MKKVKWLLDADTWKGLKISGDLTEIGSYVNYVVATPHLEMMFDSYNLYYNLIGTEPVAGNSGAGQPRKKLFYRFDSGISPGNGYQIGPSSLTQWSTALIKYGVTIDNAIGDMYCPRAIRGCFWLASPSNNSSYVYYVWNSDGGVVNSFRR